MTADAHTFQAHSFMIDTVIFDVDGVLWDAATSYNRCTLYTVTQECLRLGLPAPELSMADIFAFKRAGGFNNDWDLSWTLLVLCVARAAGKIPPEASWSELAAASKGEGMNWTRRFASDTVPSYEDVKQRYNAYYWGVELHPTIYDRPPIVPHSPGFALSEKPLYTPDLPDRLRAAGIERVGLITGRNRNEMRPILAALPFDGLMPPTAVYTGEDGDKPAPHLLAGLLQHLGARGAVMIGDSIDDLRTVLFYRQRPPAEQPAPVMAVHVAPAADAAYWYDAGADAVIPNVNQLPDLIIQKNKSTGDF